MKKKKVLFVFLMILLLVIIAEFTLFWIRAFSERQIDDVTPWIKCDADLLRKSDVLFVIPLFENKSIADNEAWCKEMLVSGKKLEMHGVYHTYREFVTTRNESYLDEGIIVFEDCFGFKPEGFKAPQLLLNKNNEKMIDNKGLKIYGYWNQLTHKVYHCNDSGMFSNKIIDIF